MCVIIGHELSQTFMWHTWHSWTLRAYIKATIHYSSTRIHVALWKTSTELNASSKFQWMSFIRSPWVARRSVQLACIVRSIRCRIATRKLLIRQVLLKYGRSWHTTLRVKDQHFYGMGGSLNHTRSFEIRQRFGYASWTLLRGASWAPAFIEAIVSHVNQNARQKVKGQCGYTVSSHWLLTPVYNLGDSNAMVTTQCTSCTLGWGGVVHLQTSCLSNLWHSRN